MRKFGADRSGRAGADLAVWPERRAQQAHRVPILQPLAIAHIRLTARDMLEVFGVDQADADAGLFQYFVGWNPVDSGRLHGRGSDAALNQPGRHLAQILSEGFEAAYRLLIPLRRHRHVDFRGAHIDARSVELDAL